MDNPQDNLAEELQTDEIHLDLDQPAAPEEATNEVVEDPVEADESVATEVAAPESSDQPLKHGQIDPSFNCPICVGEGLLDSGSICSQCQGTGKVAN